jgi:hypothetical protein
MTTRALAFALALTATGAAADPWVRADIPVKTKDWQEPWPRGCSSKDEIAMCSRFETGNWRVRLTECGTACEHWATLRFFSAIDGGYTYGEGYAEEPGAEPQGAEPAYIIPLAREGVGGVGLYALEVGFRDGSRYILLSTRNDGAMIDRASVLDTRCPVHMKGVEQRKSSRRFFFTEYCAVSSVEALEAMAREALGRAPYATMEWVRQPKS